VARDSSFLIDAFVRMSAIRSIASAPIDFAFDNLIFVDNKVFSQYWAVIIFSGSLRSSLDPPKNLESVVIERAEAQLSLYDRNIF
jgi:hypothetical protein